MSKVLIKTTVGRKRLSKYKGLIGGADENGRNEGNNYFGKWSFLPFPLFPPIRPAGGTALIDGNDRNGGNDENGNFW